MKNKEKYEKFFSEYEMCAEDAPWYKDVCQWHGDDCCGNPCKGCIKRFIEWSEQDALPDLTELEEEILKAIDPVFKFIARDKYGKMFVYRQKPRKTENTWSSKSIYTSLPLPSLFDWIQFEDAEPFCIDDHVKRKEEENEE